MVNILKLEKIGKAYFLEEAADKDDVKALF